MLCKCIDTIFENISHTLPHVVIICHRCYVLTCSQNEKKNLKKKNTDASDFQHVNSDLSPFSEKENYVSLTLRNQPSLKLKSAELRWEAEILHGSMTKMNPTYMI